MSLSGLNYEAFFREADVNNDGHLTLNELITTLRKCGYKSSDDKIKVGTIVDTMCIILHVMVAEP